MHYYTSSFFHKLTSACFEQAYWSSSGTITLYILQLFYVDWLLAGLPTANQHKRMTHTNCCIYRQVAPDDEQ